MGQNPEPGTMFGHWRYVGPNTTEKKTYRPNSWWEMECKCGKRQAVLRYLAERGGTTRCKTCHYTSMQGAVTHTFDWRDIANRRTAGESWASIAEAYRCKNRSVLLRAAYRHGFGCWDYARWFKKPSRVATVRNLLDSGKIWNEVFVQVRNPFQSVAQIKQMFNREIHRRAYKEAEKYLHSKPIRVKLLTDMGLSAAQIAEQVGIAERNVVRHRTGNTTPFSWGQLRTLAQNLRGLQLVGAKRAEYQNLLVGFLPPVREDFHWPETRAWVEAIDVFVSEMEELAPERTHDE